MPCEWACALFTGWRRSCDGAVSVTSLATPRAVSLRYGAMRARSALQSALAALTGVLYPFCFPNFDLAWLAWLLLVPLHIAIGESPPRRAFWLGWMAGWVGFM